MKSAHPLPDVRSKALLPTPARGCWQRKRNRTRSGHQPFCQVSASDGRSSGLSRRSASAARSSSTACSCSTVVSPGNGTVSRPGAAHRRIQQHILDRQHTLLGSRSANVASSSTGSIKPLKPVRANLARSTASVMKAAAANEPWDPTIGTPSRSSAVPRESSTSGKGASE